MPNWTLFDEFETFDPIAFSADSARIEQFRQCDFATAMDGELGKVIKGPDNIHLRYLPLINRVCNDKARHYVKRPTRTFEGVSEAQQQKLADLYKASGVNQFLLEAHQKAVGQNSVLLTAEPTNNPRKLRLNSWIPDEVDIESKDLLEYDARYMDKLTLRVPVHKDGWTVHYGRRIYTKDQAYTEYQGKKYGVFNDDLTNPLGYIPAVCVKLVTAPKGWFLPRLPLDLLSIQTGLIIGVSDVENIVRLKTPGREVVTGDNAKFEASRMSASPHGIFAINGDVSYQSVGVDPRVDRYLQSIETTLKLFANFRYIVPDGMWTTNSLTGAAKMVERADMLEDRIRSEQTWQAAEQDLLELITDVAAIGPSALNLADPSVKVDYHYIEPQTNDLQAAQGSALRFALGLDSAVELVASKEGVNKADAQQIITDRLERYKEIIQTWQKDDGTMQAPPGLDAIARQVVAGGKDKPAPAGAAPQGFKPHMMYDPNTGSGTMANTYEEHLALKEKGMIHEQPKYA